MTKNELLKRVNKETGLPLKTVYSLVDALVDEIKKAVASGDRVVLKGFASFEAVKRASKQGYNLQTGEKIPVPPHHGVKISASLTFRKMVKASLDTKKGKKARKK